MQNFNEPRRFTFYPEKLRTKRLVRKTATTDSWVAPEHARIAMSMQRDYPRDQRGNRVDGMGRELVIDPRPNIMVPDKPTIRLAL